VRGGLNDGGTDTEKHQDAVMHFENHTSGIYVCASVPRGLSQMGVALKFQYATPLLCPVKAKCYVLPEVDNAVSFEDEGLGPYCCL